MSTKYSVIIQGKMMSTADQIEHIIKENNIKFVDFRFTDTLGKEQHITIPATAIDEEVFESGRLFDGSSIKGWQKIHQSDLVLMPDCDTAIIDPFCHDATIALRCDVLDPNTMLGYARDPRSVAKRAEIYLQSLGFADCCYVGPEPEFFIFDDVRWQINPSGSFYAVDSNEAAWSSAKVIEHGNLGHRPAVKGGYFPVPPVDASHDIRTAICLKLEEMGLVVEAHHHEVASCQSEIATRYNSLLKKADELQVYKYVVHNVAIAYGKTATFMPKPVMDDNGNGMHCHLSLFKNGENIFAGELYAGLSEAALYYIGGILKHAPSLSAFTNPSTNSYKRLVPGFEAPVKLAYSFRNRSAAIRIPYVTHSKARRIEVRFPDPLANPYLAFTAINMAGLDGIKNKIHPGDPMEKDLYDLPAEELASINNISTTLEEAIKNLSQDYDYLLQGDVFSKDFIESYILLKQDEIAKLHRLTHPIEYEMYFSG